MRVSALKRHTQTTTQQEDWVTSYRPSCSLAGSCYMLHVGWASLLGLVRDASKGMYSAARCAPELIASIGFDSRADRDDGGV